MISVRTSAVAIVGLLLSMAAWAPRLAHAQGPADPDQIKSRIEKELEAKRETEQVVRRIATILSVLDFYDVESEERTRVLEDVARQLNQLNRGQMNEIIERLSAAARADNPSKSAAETVLAYKKHNEVIGTLRRLTGAMDSLRGLEQAAVRLEALAKRQQKVYFTTHEAIRLEEEKTKIYPKQLPGSKAHTLEVNGKIQAGDQAKVEEEVKQNLAEIKDLFPKLPDVQQERVRSMDKRVAEMDLVEHFVLATSKLNITAGPQKLAEWSKANELQQENARDLLELAALLRLHASKIEEQKSVLKQLNEAIVRQDELKRQSEQLKEKIDSLAREEKANPVPQTPKDSNDRDIETIEEGLAKLTAMAKQDPSFALQFSGLKNQLEQQLSEKQMVANSRPNYARAAAEQKQLQQQVKIAEKLGDLLREQSRLELDTAKIRNDIERLDKDLTQDLSAAEKNMKSARAALEKVQPESAANRQQKAGDDLRRARDGLEKQLVREVAPDPAKADLRQMRDQVAQALKEAREASKELKKAREQANGAELAEQQRKLADKAQERGLPKEDLENAANKLKRGMLEDALADQDKAVQKLDKAAQELKPGNEASKLAKEQRDLKQQAQTLARAKEKNEEAQSALDQVPNPPQAARDQLKEARDNLQKAQNEIAKGKTDQAAQSQARAEESLEKALSALNEAANKEPSQSSQAKAKSGKGKQGQPEEGDGPSDMAKIEPRKGGKGKGAAMEQNTRGGEGNREAKGKTTPAADSQLREMIGDSAFLSLPPREREMIRQALAGQLPAEYAAEIQQYFINIARGRAAPGVPMVPEK